MPVLSILLQPDGALVDVTVGLSRTQTRRLRTTGRPVPAPVPLRALLDIGAECTCVDSQAVASLNLPRVGISLASVPALGGLAGSTQHDASLTLLHPAGPALHLVIPDLPITQPGLGLLGYQALIGRDVLDAHCLLVYDGPGGRASLAY
jgi:hypothetical protein